MAQERVEWSDELQRFVPVGGAPAVPSAARESPQVVARPRPLEVVLSPEESIPPVPPIARAAPVAAPPPPPVRRSPQAGSDEPRTPRPKRTRRKRRSKSRVRKWAFRLIVLPMLPLLVVILAVTWLIKSQYDGIERLDVAEVLGAIEGPGTNYLIVGSDSREGIDPTDPNADAFIGTEVVGERTDTLMVLNVRDGNTRLLSIPRDLWVVNAATGQEGRINSVHQSGPDALAQTVQASLSIPIDHMIEIDFPSFGSIVEEVGGITIHFDHPARDEQSGLDVPVAGDIKLSSEQAIAYVRSRAYTELIDGQWVTDPSGDLGRTERQRAFISELFGAVTSIRNPLKLQGIVSAMDVGVRLDENLSFWQALVLGYNLRGFSPESTGLPVFDFTTAGGAAVLGLTDQAQVVLDDFR